MFRHALHRGALGLIAGVAVMPAVAAAGVVTTAAGQGADMMIFNGYDGVTLGGSYGCNFGKTPWMGASSGYGTQIAISDYCRKGYMRFDTTSIAGEIGGATTATLSLTVAAQPAFTQPVTADARVYRIYGLTNGAAGDGTPSDDVQMDATHGWPEGNRDIDLGWSWEPKWYGSTPSAPAHIGNTSAIEYLSTVTSDATLLGTFSITGAPAAGTVVDFSSTGLLSFLQADTNQLVTLILAEETTESSFGTAANGQYYRVIPFATRETAAGVGAPSLTVAVPEPASLGLLAVGGLGLLARRRRVV